MLTLLGWFNIIYSVNCAFSTLYLPTRDTQIQGAGIWSSASKIFILDVCIHILGDRGSTVAKTLCYKSEGRWFEPSWCQCIFDLVLTRKSVYRHKIQILFLFFLILWTKTRVLFKSTLILSSHLCPDFLPGFLISDECWNYWGDLILFIP